MPLRDIDGRSLGVADRVVDATIKINDHQEKITLDVAPTGRYPAVLGISWLRTHNPEINWQENQIKFVSDKCKEECLPAQVREANVSVDGDGSVNHTEHMEGELNELTWEKAWKVPVSTTHEHDEEEEDQVICAIEEGREIPKMGPQPCMGCEGIRIDGMPVWCAICSQEWQSQSIVYVAATAEEEEKPKNLSAQIASKHVEEERPAKEIVPEVYHDLLDVFDDTKSDTLPDHRPHDIAIDFVPGAVLPKPAGLYPMSDTENKEMRVWLDEMLAKDFIQPSKSPVASPCFFIPKKDSKKRLVVDWRKINAITVKDQYPLPRTDEIMDRVRGSKVFSKFDLRNGYNLIRIKKGDEWKTAFRTRWGLFEFKVMHFGLCNAPAVFQRMMNEVLAPVLDVDATNYLDDTLSFAEALPQHIETNRTILKRFREYKLYCRARKCLFHAPETEWLGVHINKDGFKMDQWKVEAIKEWKEPRTVTEIRSFLGFLNFY